MWRNNFFRGRKTSGNSDGQERKSLCGMSRFLEIIIKKKEGRGKSGDGKGEGIEGKKKGRDRREEKRSRARGRKNEKLVSEFQSSQVR